MTGSPLAAVPWTAVAGGSALGLAALATDRWLVPGGPGSPLLWLGLAAFASGAAFVLDEAAAAVVDTVPRTRRWRTARRLAAGLLPLLGWLVGTALVAWSAPGLSWRALAVTGCGAVAVTLAGATALRRGGQDTPGELVSAAVGGAVVLALLFRVPRVGSVLAADDPTTRATAWWAVLSVVAAAVTVWGSADPMARPRLRLTGRPPAAWYDGASEADRPAEPGPGGACTRDAGAPAQPL